MTRRSRSVGVLLVALLAPSACGDSTPSKQAYITKADAVCAPATSEAAAATTPSDVPGLKQFFTTLAEGTERSVAGLAKLKAPGGDAGTATKAVVQSLREGATAARAVAPAVDASDYGAIETTVRAAADAFRAADGRARSFGLRECGRGQGEAVGRVLTTLVGTVKKAYIAAADVLCKAANAELGRLEDPDTLPQVKASFERGVAVNEKLVADVKALKPPVTDRDVLDAMFAELDKALAKGKDVIAAAGAGNDDEVDQALALLDTYTSEANRKADAYGFVDCGNQGA